MPVVAAAALLVAAGGCADDASVGPDAPEPSDLDAGVAATDALDVEDAVAPEADADAARADAAPRVCSDDGFCQTSLPPIARDPNDRYDNEPRRLSDVWSDGAGAAWSVSARGEILRWDGSAWSIAYAGRRGRKLHAVWGSSPTDLWVGGDRDFGGTNGVLLHGQGATSASIVWTEVGALSGVTTIRTVWGSGAADVWAAGNNKMIHFDGTVWTVDASAPADVAYQKLWGTGPADVWVSGNGPPPANLAVLRRASDGTGAWSPMDPSGPCSYPSLLGWGEHGQDEKDHTVAFGGNASSVFLVALGDGRVRFCVGARDTVGDAGVASWTAAPLGVDYVDRTAVWSNGPNDIWIAGKYGRLDHWDGAAWTPARISLTTIPFINDFNAMFGRPGGDLWVVGSDIAYRKVLP